MISSRPSWSRLVILVPVTLLGIPELGRFGARADNPTLLDRHYWLGWSAMVTLVVVGVIVGARGDETAVRRSEEVTMTRVLVVDDDVTVREVVVTYLRAAGHEVDETADGESALALLRDQPADLVVLDLMLPGIDGLEVCERLRGARATTCR